MHKRRRYQLPKHSNFGKGKDILHGEVSHKQDQKFVKNPGYLFHSELRYMPSYKGFYPDKIFKHIGCIEIWFCHGIDHLQPNLLWLQSFHRYDGGHGAIFRVTVYQYMFSRYSSSFWLKIIFPVSVNLSCCPNSFRDVLTSKRKSLYTKDTVTWYMLVTHQWPYCRGNIALLKQ